MPTHVSMDEMKSARHIPSLFVYKKTRQENHTDCNYILYIILYTSIYTFCIN